MGDERIDLLAGMVSATKILTTDYPAIEYVVPGLIPEGMTLLVAAPKIGKSWMALGLSIACATGGNALGAIPVRQRPVLYLALEDGERRLKSRMHTLGITRPVPGLYFITRVRPGTVTATITAFLERFNGHQPVVFLDTLGRVLPPARAGDSAYQHDYKLTVDLKETVDAFPGSSLVAVHHTRKQDATDFLDAINGTQGIGGGVDTALVIRRPRQESEATMEVTARDAMEG